MMSEGQGRDFEKRQSFRYPAWNAGKRGELQLGARRAAVELCDQSAGGFAVIAEECPDISRGDVVRLHLDSNMFDARVMYVTEQPGDRPGSGRSYRIGLKRVTDFLPQDDVKPQHRSWIASLLGRVRPRYRSTSAGAGLALVLVVVLAPVLFVMVFQHLADATSDQARNGSEQSGDRPAGSSQTARAGDGPALAWLPGASVFLIPSVAQQLGLSDAQQQRIRGIVERTEDAFQRFDSRLQRMSRQGQSRNRESILQNARQEALDALTPEQRRQFQAREGAAAP